MNEAQQTQIEQGPATITPASFFAENKATKAASETETANTTTASTEPINAEAESAKNASAENASAEVANTGAARTEVPRTTETRTAESTLTPEMIAQAMIKAQQMAQPQPVKKYSQEELDDLFQRVKVTPEMFVGIMGFTPEKPEQVQALQNLLDGVVRQALTMAEYRMQYKLNELNKNFESKFQPIQQTHAAQRRQYLETTFYNKYPHLKDYKGVVEMVAEQYAKSLGQKKVPLETAIEFVARRVEELVPAAKPQPNVRKITPTAVGGSGTGSIATNKQQKGVLTPAKLFAK